MKSNQSPAMPKIPEQPLKNPARSQRIINAYRRLEAELELAGENRAPTREEVGRQVGASMRDVQPVLNVYRELAPLRESFDQVPPVMMMQLLASLNDFFGESQASYEALLKEAERHFSNGVDELSQEIQGLENEKGDLEFRLLDQKSEIRELKEQVGDLNREVAHWRDQHEAMVHKYQRVTAELREAQQDNESLQAEIETARRAHDAELQKVKDDFTTRRKELIQQHEAANDKLMTQLGNARADLRSEQAKVDRKANELQQALDIQRELRQQVSESVIARERSEAALSDLKILFEKYKDETDALRGLPEKLAETQASLEDLQQENERLVEESKSRLDFQSQFGALQEKIDQMEQRFSRSNSEHSKS